MRSRRLRLLACALAAAVIAAVGVSGCQPVTTSQASRVVALARAQLGKPYAPLGTPDNNGPYRFDCQGLAWWVYAQTGTILPHGATAQYNAVRHISAAEAQPGDLAFFHMNNDPSGWWYHHVGIVESPGVMISALNSQSGVRRSLIADVADRDGWVSYGTVRPPYNGPPPLPPIKSLHVVNYDTRGGQVSTPFALEAGHPYLVFVSGTYTDTTQNKVNYHADAECSESVTKTWSSLDLQDWIHHSDAHQDLQVNGSSVWLTSIGTGGGCNLKDHTYYLGLKPARTAPAPLRLVDDNTADNQGTLRVEFREY